MAKVALPGIKITLTGSFSVGGAVLPISSSDQALLLSSIPDGDYTFLLLQGPLYDELIVLGNDGGILEVIARGEDACPCDDSISYEENNFVAGDCLVYYPDNDTCFSGATDPWDLPSVDCGDSSDDDCECNLCDSVSTNGSINISVEGCDVEVDSDWAQNEAIQALCESEIGVLVPGDHMVAFDGCEAKRISIEDLCDRFSECAGGGGGDCGDCPEPEPVCDQVTDDEVSPATHAIACVDGDLVSREIQTVCDQVTSEDVAATHAMACIEGQVVERPIPEFCDQVIDQPGTDATHAIACVDGDIVERPIPEFCDQVNADLINDATHAIDCIDGVITRREIPSVCSGITFDTGTETTDVLVCDGGTLYQRSLPEVATQSICAQITLEPETDAAFAIQCVGENLVMRPINPCASVEDDSFNDATHALDCVNGTLTRRPLPGTSGSAAARTPVVEEDDTLTAITVGQENNLILVDMNSASANVNVDLPDATILPNGWGLEGIRYVGSSAFDLLINDPVQGLQFTLSADGETVGPVSNSVSWFDKR